MASARSWGLRTSRSDHPILRSYASTNCRSQQASYPAVCGKRATLPGQWRSLSQKIAPLVELTKQPDVKRPGIRAGGMIAIPLPNIGSMGGACGHAQEVLFPALSVDPNRFFFVRCAQPILRRGPVTHGMLGGDGIACSASSAGRRGWVERSETHPRVTA